MIKDILRLEKFYACFNIREIVQYNDYREFKELSLSYLKEQSCLVFEINGLILIKSSVRSAILDMHSICTSKKVKSEIVILQTTCHQYETRFSEVFLVLNSLTTF